MLLEGDLDAPSSQEIEIENIGVVSSSGVPGLTPSQVRSRLIENGWSVLPIYSRVLARKGAGKAPAINGWERFCAFEAPPPSLKEVARWASSGTQAPGTGIACGSVVAIDLDFAVHVDVAEEARAMAERHFGPTPFMREGHAPKVALLYRAAEAIPTIARKAADGSGDGVDILSEGRQVVGYGLHTKTAQPYQWVGSESPLTAPPEAAPEITSRQVDGFMAELGRLIELNATGGRRARSGGGEAAALVRDPSSGLITDGREGFMRNVVWRAANDISAEGGTITAEALAERAWRRFADAADTSDGRWSPADAWVKAGELIRRLGRGAKALAPKPQVAEPTYPDRRLSVAEAEEAIRREVAAFYAGPVEAHQAALAEYAIAAEAAKADEADPPLPPVPAHWGLRVETAAGKTEVAISAAVGAYKRGVATVLAVPSHKLGAELVERVRRAGAEAAVYRGFTAADPDLPGEAMCHDLPAFEDAQAAGVGNVRTAICERRSEDGVVWECPHNGVCGMSRQRAAKPQIWIVPHQLLYRQRPGYIPRPDALIVDEGFALGALPEKPSSYGLDAMGEADFAVRSGPIELVCESNDLETARAKLLRALRDHEGDGPLRRAILARHGVDEALAGSARRLEWRRALDPGMTPGMPPITRKAQAARVGSHNATVKRWAALWHVLRDFLVSGEEASGRMWLRLDPETEARRLEWRIPAQFRAGWSAPVLAIDATLPAAEILSTVVGAPVEVRADIAARWSPHGVVRQVVGAPVSASKLGIVAGRERETDPLVVRDLVRLVRVRAAFAWPRTVVVIAPLRLVEKLTEAGLPQNVEVGNFNGVAGIDRWRDAAGLICVGRPLPGPREVEAMAAAMTGRVPQAVPAGEHGGAWYPAVPGAIRLASGEGYAITYPAHPDPSAEAVRQQICEANLIQALGRLRALRRDAESPYFADIVSDVVLDLTVDQVETWEQAKPGAWADMAAEGVLLSSPADAVRAFPELGLTAETARRVCDLRLVCTPIENPSIRVHTSLTEYEYRRAGRFQPARAFVLPNGPADLSEWLAARLGALAYVSPLSPQSGAPPL